MSSYEAITASDYDPSQDSRNNTWFIYILYSLKYQMEVLLIHYLGTQTITKTRLIFDATIKMALMTVKLKSYLGNKDPRNQY
jgi:hypothetical protein